MLPFKLCIKDIQEITITEKEFTDTILTVDPEKMKTGKKDMLKEKDKHTNNGNGNNESWKESTQIVSAKKD